MKNARVGSVAYKTAQAAKNAEAKARAEAVFKKHAQAVFLAYHENAGWAVRKVEAGIHLTPEAVEYMEREVNARKLAEEARAKNLEKTDVENPENELAAIDKSAGTGERDVGSAGNDVQKGI